MTPSEPVTPAASKTTSPPGPVPSQESDSAKKHRAQQTLRNLVFALVACLGVLILMLIVVPRDNSSLNEAVDYRAAAEGIQATTDWQLAVPDLPAGWSANRVDISDEPSNDIQIWTIGFITPKHQYIRLEQVAGANPTWINQQLDGRRASGATTLSGQSFVTYDQRDDPDFQKGQNDYALTADVAGTTLIFNGTADDDEFAQLVNATLSSLNR